MTEMLVLSCDTEEGADEARNKILELDKQYLFGLDQVVEVVRHKDGRVKIKQEPKFTGIAAVGGAFWGLLIGIIFFVPLIGVAVGAAAGAIAGHFAKYGISSEFMQDVERSIQPGNSALFILAENVKIDRLVPQIAGLRPRILRTSLSADQEEKLKEAFGSGDASGRPMTATV
jgi:uncharacterized membrane protein